MSSLAYKRRCDHCANALLRLTFKVDRFASLPFSPLLSYPLPSATLHIYLLVHLLHLITLSLARKAFPVH